MSDCKNCEKCDCKKDNRVVVEDVPATGTFCDKCPSTDCMCRLCAVKSFGEACSSIDTGEPGICNFPMNDKGLKKCMDEYMDKMGIMEN